MNTMYRNSIGDQPNDKTGYLKTQSAIASRSDGILSLDNVRYRNNLLDELKIKDEERAVEELYRLAKDMPGMTWAADRQQDINSILKYFGRAPKALLHVHSTAGLSVQNLGALIESWNENQNKNQQAGLKIYHATVTLPSYKEPIQNVLMYKKQYDDLKGKGLASNGGVPLAGWFKEHLSDFYISEPSDIDTNWDMFGRIYIRTEHLFRDAGFYKEYHTRFFKECLEDNISYVELRTGFAEFTKGDKLEEIEKGIVFLRPGFSMKDYFYHADPLTSPDPTNPDAEFLQLISSAKEQANEEWEKSGKPARKLEVKVILTANRNKAIHNMKDTCDKVDAAISMKNGIGSGRKEVADMIVGFDFVDMEKKTWGLTEELRGIVYGQFSHEGTGKFKSKLDKLKGKCRMQLIRFFLHDGESTDIIGDCGSNAVTGPICSRHRIGHGFQMGTPENLNPGKGSYGEYIMNYILNGYTDDIDRQQSYPIVKFGDIENEFKRVDYIVEPVIELCPISNYMLGYVKNLKEHPAIPLMENGILAVICNDDPQLFYSKGLSCDYAMMYIGLIKYFEEKYKDKPDEKEKNAKTKAYEYLKISSFLGYFYEEMSKKYYIPPKAEDDITEVNDILPIEGEEDQEGEREVFKVACDKFILAWSNFIDPSKGN